MKDILGNVSDVFVKITTRLKLSSRRFMRRFSAFFAKPSKSRARSYDIRKSEAVLPDRPNRGKKCWQNKRIVIFACCCLAVAVAIVLAIVIPAPKNTAMASVENAIAANSDGNNGLEIAAAQDAQLVSLDQSGAAVSPSGGEDLVVAETTSPTPIPTTAPDEGELVPGVHDSRLFEIQQRLMDLDYLDDDEPTDYYGSGTEYALQLFQRKNNLQVDGLLGKNTLSELFSDEALPYTVKLGDRGSDVVAMQERLQALNYLKAGKTGYFGTDTETAVKSFQKRNGLSADGNVGEYTREVLYSEDAKAAKTTSTGSAGGSSTGGGTAIAVGNPDEASVDKLIEIAKTKLGCEYTRAGKGPDEFDCSGFVYYCLNTAGYKIGYMTSKGWSNCSLPKVTSMGDMQKGDIICFKGHVGIYMGGGQMIDAGSSSDNVRICNNILGSAYWTRNFICARRVF